MKRIIESSSKTGPSHYLSLNVVFQLLGPGMMVGVAFLYMERSLAEMLSRLSSVSQDAGLWYVAPAMSLNIGMIAAFWYVRYRTVFDRLRWTSLLTRGRVVYQAFCILTWVKVSLMIVAEAQSPEEISLIADVYTVLVIAIYSAYTFYLSNQMHHGHNSGQRKEGAEN